jgi:hypothetical protein
MTSDGRYHGCSEGRTRKLEAVMAGSLDTWCLHLADEANHRVVGICCARGWALETDRLADSTIFFDVIATDRSKT